MDTLRVEFRKISEIFISSNLLKRSKHFCMRLCLHSFTLDSVIGRLSFHIFPMKIEATNDKWSEWPYGFVSILRFGTIECVCFDGKEYWIRKQTRMRCVYSFMNWMMTLLYYSCSLYFKSISKIIQKLCESLTQWLTARTLPCTYQMVWTITSTSVQCTCLHVNNARVIGKLWKSNFDWHIPNGRKQTAKS